MVKASILPPSEPLNTVPPAAMPASPTTPPSDLAADLGLTESDPLDGGRPVGGTAVANRPPAAVANRYSEMSDGAISGEFDSSDIKYPALRIVNGSGKLSQEYNQGTTLLGDDLLWDAPNPKSPDPKQVFRFVPVTIQKQFRENLSQDRQEAGEFPRIVDTLDEVHASGGTIEWVGRQKPSWQPCAKCSLLVEAPEGTAHPGFGLEFGGKAYALVAYYAAGSAYGRTVKTIFNVATSSLMEPVLGPDGQPARTAQGYLQKKVALSKKFWTWRTIKVLAGDFTIFVPEIRLTTAEVPAEIREFLSGIVSGA